MLRRRDLGQRRRTIANRAFGNVAGAAFLKNRGRWWSFCVGADTNTAGTALRRRTGLVTHQVPQRTVCQRPAFGGTVQEPTLARERFRCKALQTNITT
jgi:hypothetical protein